MVSLGFIGNAVRDAELRSTQTGVNVCTFTVAVNNRYNKEKPPTYFRVTAWRKLAENCGKFIKKGQKLYVHCNEIEIQSYDSNGETKNSLCVTADDVEFLSRAEEGSNNSSYSNNNQSDNSYQQEPEPQNTSRGFTPVEIDSELPF